MQSDCSAAFVDDPFIASLKLFAYLGVHEAVQEADEEALEKKKGRIQIRKHISVTKLKQNTIDERELDQFVSLREILDRKMGPDIDILQQEFCFENVPFSDENCKHPEIVIFFLVVMVR